MRIASGCADDGGGHTAASGRRARLGAGLRAFPRQYWLLAAGTFVYLIGVEMCYPFETIYLNQRLGLSMTTIGLVIGLALFLGLPFQVAGGAMADRLGRRPLLALGVFASASLYLGLGLSHQLWLVLALIVFEAAFGWAQFITAGNAMVADLTPFARRAEAFSITRAAMNVGITLGPLVAAPLIAADPSFRLSFVTGSLVCLVFFAMILTLFKETRPAELPSESLDHAFRGYGVIVRDRRMLAFCLVSLLPLYAFGQIWVTLPIMLADVHDIPAQRWGLLLVANGAVTAILQYPMVRWLRRRDHMLLLAVSSCCMGLGLAAAAFVPWPLTFASVVIIAVGVVLFVPFTSTVVSRLAPVELRGRYMGAWTMVYMGGYALGPLLGGWALDALGGRAAFVVTGAACLLGGGLFVLLRGAAGSTSDHPDEEEPDVPPAKPRGGRPEQLA